MTTESKKKYKYQLSLVFDSFDDLTSFSREITRLMKLGVYKADALDPEFAGHAPKNSYVLREVDGIHGKPEEWRIA